MTELNKVDEIIIITIINIFNISFIISRKTTDNEFQFKIELNKIKQKIIKIIYKENKLYNFI